METPTIQGSEAIVRLKEFLQFPIPERKLDAGRSITGLKFLSQDDVRRMLPEKGPFLFFNNNPVAFVSMDEDSVALGIMTVHEQFCAGHVISGKSTIPLYMFGGAAGQLCAIFTTYLGGDNHRCVAIGSSGSATATEEGLVPVGSRVLFLVKMIEQMRVSRKFSYEVYLANKLMGRGEISTLYIPERLIARQSHTQTFN